MEIDRLLQEIREQGRRLLNSANAAGLDAPVPTCPEWRVADLLAHIGYVHRWAAAHVAGALTGPLDDAAADRAVGAVPDGDGLYRWYAEGHGALVDALAAAPADLQCWAFLPAPTPLMFWARRQAHETAIHRADADRAAGRDSDYDHAFAADGIDELLTGFLARRRGRLTSDPPRSLAVSLTDADATWHVSIGPDSRTVTRDAAAADCHVRGPASAVYQLLWNRRHRDGLRVEGDSSVLDLFAAKAQVRWS